jgi:hypothetical protein
MRRRDANDLDLAGLVVDLYLGDLGGVNIGAERLALSGLGIHGDGWWVVRRTADGGAAEYELAVVGDIADRQALLRKAEYLDLAVARLQLVGADAE